MKSSTSVLSFPFAVETATTSILIAAFALLITGVTPIAVILGAAGATLLYFASVVRSGPPKVTGFPIVGAVDFFTRRYDFLTENRRKYGNIFEFNLLQHRVFALGGASARVQYFSNHTQLNFTEGYKVLFGGVPVVTKEAVGTAEAPANMPQFNKRLLALIAKKERLAEGLPVMLSDISKEMAKWGREGVMDPFVDVYGLVFKLTCRMLGCREIAEDEGKIAHLTKLYWDMEAGSGVLPVLFPWFPSQAKKRHEAASMELFKLVIGVIETRRALGTKENDAVQFLMDSGDSNVDIAQFVMGSLFAGIINTGINSAWLLLQVAQKPVWRERVLGELRDLVIRYNYNGDETVQITSLNEELTKLPLDSWEDGLPVLEKCLREVVRMTLTGATLRRVMAKGFVVDGYELPLGSFVTYSPGDAHFNPQNYSRPFDFDPERYDPPRLEDKNGEPFAFLGWGAGRHPCLGMRFAKLEMKIICALALANYEFAVADANGKVLVGAELPEPNRNNIHTQRPAKPVYMRYNKI